MTINNPLKDALWTEIKSKFFAQAEAVTQLGDKLLHNLGALYTRQNELWAGAHCLHHKHDLLSLLAQATGLGLALYVDRHCIATFLPENTRAHSLNLLGSYADDDLADRVLQQAKVFSGTIKVEQVERLSLIRPLFATTNREIQQPPLGMFEAFQSQDLLFQTLSAAPTTKNTIEIDKIEPIHQFLADLARRLQLLALNGNIIAAQAGEHGRAFRVVCQELSTLAQRAKTNSQDPHSFV